MGEEVEALGARAKLERCGSAALALFTMQRINRYVTCAANQETVSDRNLLHHLRCAKRSLVHQHLRPQGSSATGAHWLISRMPGSVLPVTQLLGPHLCEILLSILATLFGLFRCLKDIIFPPGNVAFSLGQNEFLQ